MNRVLFRVAEPLGTPRRGDRREDWTLARMAAARGEVVKRLLRAGYDVDRDAIEAVIGQGPQREGRRRESVIVTFGNYTPHTEDHAAALNRVFRKGQADRAEPSTGGDPGPLWRPSPAMLAAYIRGWESGQGPAPYYPGMPF